MMAQSAGASVSAWSRPRSRRRYWEELLIPFAIGRSPHDVERIYEDLYDLQRVRGHFGGYALDAIAGLDMALWDLRGKLLGQPVYQLLGGLRHERLPVYVSGLPGATKAERAALGKRWIDRGFSALKFAAVVADEGEVAEIEGHSPGDRRETENPCRSPLALFRAGSDPSLSTGYVNTTCILRKPRLRRRIWRGRRRWPAPFARRSGWVRSGARFTNICPRLQARCMNVIQPEIAHTGITGFRRICELAQAFHCRVMPHATINVGIAQAASLHVAATLANFAMQEYQHSIFDRNKQFIHSAMDCQAGCFTLPQGPGLGTEPTDELLNFVIKSS